MTLNKSKSTKRFNFNVSRNTTSKKAGANTVTIQTQPYDTNAGRGYSFQSNEVPGTVTMSIKEAKALNSFLSTHLSDPSVS